MKLGSARSSIACGLSAVIASVSLAGCAGVPYINRPLYTVDLDHFNIDYTCQTRDQQVRFLLGQLSTNDDRLLAWWTNYMDPRATFSSHPDYQLRTDISSRYTNWLVGQQLLRIKKFCG